MAAKCDNFVQPPLARLTRACCSYRGEEWSLR
jgi:hypothetical protein